MHRVQDMRCFLELTTFSISGLLLIRPKVFRDARGLFFEAFHAERYQREAGLSGFVQDNISVSSQGTLRGLHYQVNRPQGKLVQVLQGKVWDVAVDIRQGSPTFGHWEGVELDSQYPSQFYIPPGFAHGFQVLSDRPQGRYLRLGYLTNRVSALLPAVGRPTEWLVTKLGLRGVAVPVNLGDLFTAYAHKQTLTGA